MTGERVGCLVLATSSKEVATNSQSLLESLQRSEVSNPPAFGARIAATILTDDEARASWFEDLRTMSGRIQSMRASLHNGLTERKCYFTSSIVRMLNNSRNEGTSGNWDHLLRQSGMFGFLGLSPSVVKELKG